VAARSGIQTFDLWRKAHTVTLTIFEITELVPPEQQAGFTGKWRECAIELTVAIASAYQCKTPAERVGHYTRALEWVERLCYLAVLAADLDLLEPNHPRKRRCEEIGRMIHANINRYRKESP